VELSEYKILRRLGAGGMAEVFLADKVGAAGFSRTVAIKTILASGAPSDAITLFLDEARVASGLNHPGIVQTLDLSYEHETLFIVMEFVPGPPLSRVIYEMKRSGRFLPAHIVAFVGAEMASALDFAHRRVTAPDGTPLELVHRDVSPQNILLTRHAVVKLTDFGVARASIQMHKTKTGQVRGKAAYMAPEQVRAKKLDGRTDMFALGLVLYEALTCIRPYQRKSDINSMRAILSEKVPPIAEANPNVPEELIAVIMKTLEKKPNNRYEHCGALEAALRATYAHMRESSIESEIGELMNELFGEQQWRDADEGPLVEAWQPTINVDEHGNAAIPKPQRIAGQSMSPEVANMLGLTQEKESELGAALFAPAGSQPEPISIVPYVPGGTAPHNSEGPVTMPPQGGYGQQITGAPQAPVVSAYNLTPTGMEPRPFTDVQLPSAAFSNPHTLGLPAESAAFTGAQKSRLGPAATIALAVAIVLTGAVLYAVMRTPEVTSAPGAERRRRGGFVATQGESTQPPPIQKPPPRAPTPPPPPPVERVARPKPTPKLVKRRPKPAPAQPTMSRAEYEKRLLAAFKRGKTAKIPGASKVLDDLVWRFQNGNEPTAADRRRLERAEKQLQ